MDEILTNIRTILTEEEEAAAAALSLQISLYSFETGPAWSANCLHIFERLPASHS